MNTTTSAPGPASVDRPKSSAAWASAGHTIAMNAAGAPRRSREETLFIRAMRMEDDVNEKSSGCAGTAHVPVTRGIGCNLQKKSRSEERRVGKERRSQ